MLWLAVITLVLYTLLDAQYTRKVIDHRKRDYMESFVPFGLLLMHCSSTYILLYSVGFGAGVLKLVFVSSPKPSTVRAYRVEFGVSQFDQCLGMQILVFPFCKMDSIRQVVNAEITFGIRAKIRITMHGDQDCTFVYV